MRHRRAIANICDICRDFGYVKLRVVRVKEGPDRGGARGKVLRACRSIVAALEQSEPCSNHRKTLRLARGIVEDLARVADEAKAKRRYVFSDATSRTGRQSLRTIRINLGSGA